ncbi:MAG: transglycosylase domain-containing protein, partial [Longimicrobiales bacterium]
LVLGALAAVVVTLVTTGATLAAGQDCPTVAEILAYEPPEASRVFAVDGTYLADLSPHRRVVLAYDEIPAMLRDAYVAVEDRRFWEHDGIDFRGVARAIVSNVTSLSIEEGFSTITMQIARNIFPEQLPMSAKFGRKLCEVRLAPALEDALSKPEILALYVNQIYLGDGTYGVAAAARGYFGKSVAELRPGEAAMLVALGKSPYGYDPRRNPELARRRRNIVLDVMAREDVITSDVAEAEKRAPIVLAPPLESATSAPYVVVAVRAELRALFGDSADTGGYRVRTAIEPGLQNAARTALRAHLRRIENGDYGHFPHPAPEDGELEAAPAGGSQYLQGMVVALDPATGAIRALVGGRDFSHSQYDRTRLAQRQPGSAFKPIVYAAALSDGMTLATRVETSPVALATGGASPWSPRDHVADSVEALTVRQALVRSVNNASVRIGRWTGERRIAALAHELGISTRIPLYPSIILGSAEVIPIELVAAYAAFGNGGFRVEPHLITRVEDIHGEPIWTARQPRRRVLAADIAFLTLSALRDVVDSGTGVAVREAGFLLPAAGKTGTTNAGKDAWFIGLTPDLAAGVWVGFDMPAPILAGGAGGAGGLAAPAWGEMMSAYYTDRIPPMDWVPPPSIQSLPIDALSGGVATGNCPPDQVLVEHFGAGTAPREFCPLHPESGVERFFDRLFRRIGL